MLIPVIIQLADASFMRRFIHATVHEPTATNPDQGLLVFKADQNEVEPLLQRLAQSNVCEFTVLFPTANMILNHCKYIVEIRQPSQGITFFQQGKGIAETDSAKATRFGSYFDALQLITDFLNPDRIVLSEPVEIRIAPAPSDEPWTVEEILAREG